MSGNSQIINHTDDEHILKPFIDIILEVRKELSEKYDVTNTDSGQYAYASLCYESIKMVIEKVKRDFNSVLTVESFHGEQSRHHRIESKFWVMEHDWCRVFIEDGRCIYLDPTSQQFQKYYNDIPDYIVSFDRPVWYIEDQRNPSWNGLGKVINEKVRIPLRVTDTFDTESGCKIIVKEGIVDFIQYEILGTLSDMIRELKKITIHMVSEHDTI